jgi:hypothetical protein
VGEGAGDCPHVVVERFSAGGRFVGLVLRMPFAGSVAFADESVNKGAVLDLAHTEQARTLVRVQLAEARCSIFQSGSYGLLLDAKRSAVQMARIPVRLHLGHRCRL